MVVKQFKGRGRHAVVPVERKPGGWLFRLYMAWFWGGMGKQ